VFLQCPSHGIIPSIPKGSCMDCWKLARKDPKLFECVSILKEKNNLILTMLSLHQIQSLCLLPCTHSTPCTHCSRLPLHKPRIWGYSQLSKQLIHTHHRPFQQQKSFISHSAANSLKVGVGEQHSIATGQAVMALN